jgi:RNA polymerase sigma-70 factor, ECF subfamily
MPESSNVDWDAAYWEYMPRLYNFFLYRFADRALAEDLTAATFEKAWRRREQYQESRGSILTWLFSIARHTATDYRRQHRHDLPLESALHLADSQSIEERTSEALTRQHNLRQLSALIEHLNPREQELVALKYGGKLTNRAIAQITRLSESNVGTILFRIIKQLREAWEPIRYE